MKSLKFSIILFSLLTLAICTQAQDPTYLYHYCPNTTTFTRNSTYQDNLNLLLSSLSSNATRNNINGFYNVSTGQDPDDVYGMFLCRGDVSDSVCRNCVNFATKDVLEMCPNEKVTMIWYDECELRYSNRNIFSTVDQDLTLFMSSPDNVTVQPERFNQLVATTINNISTRAAAARSGAKKFAVQEAHYTGLQKLYTLVQCTPDLSSSDCSRCLEGAISKLGNCCNRKQGGRVIFASCNFRYEVYNFYKATAAAEAETEAAPSTPPVALSPPPASGSGTRPKGKKSDISRTVVTAVVPVDVSVMLIICICIFLRVRKQEKEVEALCDIEDVELLQLDFSTVRMATDNFSEDNKLGQGGFGAVYKGTLPNGQEIAVKRLSRSSGQGELEFKNEVILVARLQHRNLVRLQGFCLEKEERLLVYEFLPNSSLNNFIFDPVKRVVLDWEKSYKIITSIARGLLYLHEDSRLRIIHRDLKASNILLDAEMNPKIADFGMARLFAANQTQDNTNRVVGTFGYMAPEYITRGHFSMKSDVFSFGVLVLEIVSGKKNYGCRIGDQEEDLLTYSWRNWYEGTALDIIDPTLNVGSISEMMRCIHIGLLCVQENEALRPTMAEVSLMLSSYSVTPAIPSKPAFFMPSERSAERLPSLEYGPMSNNEVTISELNPR